MASSEIELSDGQKCIVDESDYEYLNQFSWCPVVTKSSGPYVRARVDGRNVFMHRLLMGFPPCLIDHKDGNPLNNRRDNLRHASNSQNAANMRMAPTNTSGVKGVYWSKGKRKWVANIKVNYRTKYLGAFSEIEDAANAYQQAANELFGEFALGGDTR